MKCLMQGSDFSMYIFFKVHHGCQVENGLKEEKAEAGKTSQETIAVFQARDDNSLYLSGDSEKKWAKFKIYFRGRKLRNG